MQNEPNRLSQSSDADLLDVTKDRDVVAPQSQRSSPASLNGKPNQSDILPQKKKKKRKIILIVCLAVGIPLLIVLSIPLLIWFDMTVVSSAKMQGYLEDKYGQDEHFHFTGKCKGGFDFPYECFFTSDATDEEQFSVTSVGKGFREDYLHTKFKKPLENYFNDKIKEVNSISSYVDNIKVNSWAYLSSNSKSYVDPHISFDNYLADPAVKITLIINVRLNDSMVEVRSANSSYKENYKEQVKWSIEANFVRDIITSFKEQQVPKNIEKIIILDDSRQSVMPIEFTYKGDSDEIDRQLQWY